MKKLLLIIAIAEFFIMSKVVAQGDPCTATCFTYRFCDGTNRGEICTNDSYRVTIGGQKVKPQKLSSLERPERTFE